MEVLRIWGGAMLALRGSGKGCSDGGTQVGNVGFCDFEGDVPVALGMISSVAAIIESEYIEALGSEELDVGESVPAIPVQLMAVDDGPPALIGQAAKEGAGQFRPVLGLEMDLLAIFDGLTPVGGQPGATSIGIRGNRDAQHTSHHVQDEGENEECQK